MRTHQEEIEVTNLLRQFDLTVAKLGELGVDVFKLRGFRPTTEGEALQQSIDDLRAAR